MSGQRPYNIKLIDGLHCSNCYNCKTKYGRAYCKKDIWRILKSANATKFDVDVKNIVVSRQYGRFAEGCLEYVSME